MREFTIHIYGILLIPITQLLLCKIFLSVAFGFEDAYLSSAVVASGFHLSLSYYYTVYGPVADTTDAYGIQFSLHHI